MRRLLPHTRMPPERLWNRLLHVHRRRRCDVPARSRPSSWARGSSRGPTASWACSRLPPRSSSAPMACPSPESAERGAEAVPRDAGAPAVRIRRLTAPAQGAHVAVEAFRNAEPERELEVWGDATASPAYRERLERLKGTGPGASAAPSTSATRPGALELRRSPDAVDRLRVVRAGRAGGHGRRHAGHRGPGQRSRRGRGRRALGSRVRLGRRGVSWGSSRASSGSRRPLRGGPRLSRRSSRSRSTRRRSRRSTGWWPPAVWGSRGPARRRP